MLEVKMVVTWWGTGVVSGRAKNRVLLRNWQWFISWSEELQ